MIIPLPDLRPPVPVRWLWVGLTLLVPLVFGAMYFVRRPLAARLGGWAGLLAGIFWMLTTWLLMDEFTSNAWVFMVAPTSILLAIGTVGLGALRGSWWLGQVGWVLATLAAIVFGVSYLLGVYFDLDGGWLITIVSLLTYTVGLMLFGIAALHKPVLWRFNGLPLVVGLLGGPIAMAASFALQQNEAWSYILYMTGLGVGWILLGALVVKTNSKKAT